MLWKPIGDSVILCPFFILSLLRSFHCQSRIRIGSCLISKASSYMWDENKTMFCLFHRLQRLFLLFEACKLHHLVRSLTLRLLLVKRQGWCWPSLSSHSGSRWWNSLKLLIAVTQSGPQGCSVCPSHEVKIINLCSVETQGESVCWRSLILSFDSQLLDKSGLYHISEHSLSMMMLGNRSVA